MKFGMCIGGDAKKIAICKKLGFDYVESGFSLLADEKEASDYDAFMCALKENDMQCLSVNCFLPGSLKVTGPDVDKAGLAAYVERGMMRGAAMGVKKVVFGSGGARNVPEGFCFAEAVRQICTFLSDIVAPLAEKYGITVVIEPLSRKDTNIIHTLHEGADLVAFVDRDCIRLLGDLYHMYNNGDKEADVRMMRGILKHAHISEPEKRVYPAPGDAYDYAAFIEALEFSGCETCSVEARSDDFEADAAKAIRALRGE